MIRPLIDQSRQSALIPSSSQELYFLVPFWVVCRQQRAMTQQHKQTSLTSTATDSTWNPIAEKHAAASFTHASYKPRTNILTSDAKRDTSSLSLLYTCYDNKPFFVVLFKRSFVIHLYCQIIYSVREIYHFPKHKIFISLNLIFVWHQTLYMLLSTKKEDKTQFSEESVKFPKYEKKNKQKRKRQNYLYSMRNWKNWTIFTI